MCDYAASASGTLKRHVKDVHEKVKGFKCVLCEYATSQASSLKLHVKAVHVEKRDIIDYATAQKTLSQPGEGCAC